VDKEIYIRKVIFEKHYLKQTIENYLEGVFGNIVAQTREYHLSTTLYFNGNMFVMEYLKEKNTLQFDWEIWNYLRDNYFLNDEEIRILFRKELQQYGLANVRCIEDTLPF
jgi:hypothetical protein